MLHKKHLNMKKLIKWFVEKNEQMANSSERSRVNQLELIYVIVGRLLHASIDKVDLLSRSFVVQAIIVMRFQHLQISFEFREFFSVNRHEEVQNEEWWPNWEVGDCHIIAGNVRISISEESFDICISPNESTNLVIWNRRFTAIANWILQLQMTSKVVSFKW